MANCISVKNVIVSNKDCTPSSGKTLKGTTLSYLAYSLSEYYRNALYDLLNGTGYFSSKTLSKYTEQEDVGIYGLRIYGELFQIACVLDKAQATKVELRVYNSNDYYSTYVITNLDDEALLQIDSEKITLTTGLTTFMYRGSRNGSFMINISIDGSKKQNMAFMTIHKFVDSEVIGFRGITATAGTYHNVLATVSIFAYDVVSTATTISTTTMASYVNTVDTMQKRSQFFHNILMHQMYGSYKDNSVIVGNQKYYRQYNFYEVEGNAYYCVTNGVLLLVDKIK